MQDQFPTDRTRPVGTDPVAAPASSRAARARTPGSSRRGASRSSPQLAREHGETADRQIVADQICRELLRPWRDRLLRAPDRPGLADPDQRPIAVRRPRLVELSLAEPPHGGRGTHIPRGKSRRTRRRTQRRARQLTSQAGRAASRYAVFRPSLRSTTRHQRAVGRNLALDLVVGDRRRGDRRPRHDPSADHRPARRARADRPGRSRRRAVRGQPAGRVRRPRRAWLAAAAGPHPRRRRGVAARSWSSSPCRRSSSR